MRKLTEHIRRRLVDMPPRFYALMATGSALMCTLLALFLTLNIVIVSDSDGNKRMLVTAEQTPAELMSMSGIVAEEYDQVFYTAYNGNLASLNIQRAIEATVMVDGATKTARLGSGTVEDVLSLCEVQLGEHDYTEPSLHTIVEDGMSIAVHRVEYNDVVTYEEIPYEVTYKLSSLLHRFKNRTYTLSEGSNGQNEITNRQRVVDGVVESEQVVSVNAVKQPVNQVILAYGAGAPVSERTAPAGVTINGNVPSSYSRVISNAICTGYSAKAGRGSSRLGLYAGTVAVNPNVIPYGTEMYITSADGSFVYGWAIATDTGTALMEGIIDLDLFYDTYRESALNGKKALNVYIM